MYERLFDLLKNAYHPNDYIGYSAIVLTNDEHAFTGVSIKNPVFRDCITAEQAALSKAIVKGYKKEDMKEIYIMVNKVNFKYFNYINNEFITELMNDDKKITLINIVGEEKTLQVKDLNYY